MSDPTPLTPTLPSAGGLSTGPPAPPGWDLRTDTLPEHFGRYHVSRLLGRGGMGSVYLAHDTELDRPVALKVPRLAAEEGTDAFERFRREARAAATLAHPGICPVYDVGVQGGIPFLTMAYVEGRTLATLVKSGPPLSPRQAAELVRKLAAALAEAHRRGVVHRDLKPSNVMIDARGEPVIMDFGLARRAAPGEAQLTRVGEVMGTPAYMAPEQAAGETVGPACDVYSLGVLFYELLAGCLPFQGETLSVLMAQVLTAKPLPPSAHRPGLDPALEAICLKAMAKAPAQRHASMSDFAAALGAYLGVAGEASPAPSAGPVPLRPAETRAWPPPEPAVVKAEPAPVRRRGRRTWLLGSAALIILGVPLAVALPWLTRSRNPERGGAPAVDTRPAPGEGARAEPRHVLREVLTAVHDHLGRTPGEDRPFQRYLTLAHLAGRKGGTEEDLRWYRLGLSRLVRDLGGEKAVTLDPDGTVFAIDLRRGGWDRHHLWDEVLKGYPYGLRLQGHSDPAVRELAARVAEQGDPRCDVLCIRADWFVARASRPPLWHALARLTAAGGPPKEPAETEGIAALTRRYEQDVTPEDAARELGLADTAALLSGLKDNPDLQKRGLGPLTQGGAVPRWAWESAVGRTATLFQEAADLLGCGTPVSFLDE